MLQPLLWGKATKSRKKLNNIGGQLQKYLKLLNVSDPMNRKWNTRIKCRLFSVCKLTKMSLFLAINILSYSLIFSQPGTICKTSQLNRMSLLISRILESSYKQPLSQCHDFVFTSACLEILYQNHEKRKKNGYIFFDLWSNSKSSINGKGGCLLMKLKRNTVHVFHILTAKNYRFASI